MIHVCKYFVQFQPKKLEEKNYEIRAMQTVERRKNYNEVKPEFLFLYIIK